MDVILYVSAIMALLSVAILCVYLVLKLGPLIRQVQSSLAQTQATLDNVGQQIGPTLQHVADIKQELVPILRNVQETTHTSISISSKVDVQLNKTGEMVNEVAELASRVAAIERDFEDQIVEPIRQIGSVVSSTSKAIKVFAGVMAGSGGNRSNGAPSLPDKD